MELNEIQLGKVQIHISHYPVNNVHHVLHIQCISDPYQKNYQQPSPSPFLYVRNDLNTRESPVET